MCTASKTFKDLGYIQHPHCVLQYLPIARFCGCLLVANILSTLLKKLMWLLRVYAAFDLVYAAFDPVYADFDSVYAACDPVYADLCSLHGHLTDCWLLYAYSVCSV